MTNELRNAIQQLRSVSPQLNQATDDANRVVQLVEKFLNEECSIGLPASVKVSSTDTVEEASDRATYTQTSLAYARVEGKFRLAVIEEERIMHLDDNGEFDFETAGQSQVTAWSSAPRDVKLSTFVRLPDLVQTIADKARVAVQSTNEAAQAVQEIIGAIAGDDGEQTASGEDHSFAGAEDRQADQRQVINESRKKQAEVAAAQEVARNQERAKNVTAYKRKTPGLLNG